MFKIDLRIIDILGHLIVWLLLTIFTLGIAFFFFPYSFSKFILNRTFLVDKNGTERKLVCEIDIAGNIGHIVLWIIITILTLGIGYLFYLYRVWGYVIRHTRVS